MTIKICKERCKGCRLCVEFCPKKVLSIGIDKKVQADVANCISCKRCEEVCPEFAIDITEGERSTI